MEIFDKSKVSQDIVTGILSFIDSKLVELEKKGVYYNRVIREDILPLLDSQCTIIYYPTDDSVNNGFHKTYRFKGKDLHFVYINTNQDIEKQIFTAAHELGHVWKIDEYLMEFLGISIDYELGERIMNRFAAEFLMPSEIFKGFFKKGIDDKAGNAGAKTVKVFIQIITEIMNEFYVPYKSVVYRLYELDLISEKVASILWNGTSSLQKSILTEYSKEYAQEQRFLRLYHPNGIRNIAGLQEKLDYARNKSSAPEQWLQKFYTRFDLKPSDDSESLTASIPVE